MKNRSKEILGFTSVSLIGLAAMAGQANAEEGHSRSLLTAYSSDRYSNETSFSDGHVWDGFFVGILGNGAIGSFTTPSGTAASIVDKTNYAVGLGVGYNTSFGPLVAGGEADYLINFNDGETNTATGIRSTNKTQGSLRLKAGTSVGDYLLYGTGGLAFGEGIAEASNFSDEQTHVGYTLGAGVEFGLLSNFTARIEFRYSDLGEETYSLNGANTNIELDTKSINLGLFYNF